MLIVQHSKGSKARWFISLKVFIFIHVYLIRLVIRKPKYCFWFFFGGGWGVRRKIMFARGGEGGSGSEAYKFEFKLRNFYSD